MKPRTNSVVAIIAAVILAVVAYKRLTHRPLQLASKPTAETCTPEAIQHVTDALERSILSAKCASLAKPFTGKQ